MPEMADRISGLFVVSGGVRAAIVVIVSAHAHNTKEDSEAFTQQQDGADYKSKRLQDKERLFYSQTTFSQRAEQSSSEKEEVRGGLALDLYADVASCQKGRQVAPSRCMTSSARRPISFPCLPDVDPERVSVHQEGVGHVKSMPKLGLKLEYVAGSHATSDLETGNPPWSL